MILLTILLFFMEDQYDLIQGEYIFKNDLALITLILSIIYLFFILNPFPFFFLSLRKGIARVILENASAPFYPVKFRHFMIGNTLISLTLPIKDFGMMIAFFSTGNWIHSQKVNPSDHIGLYVYTLGIGILLLWFRFVQCFVRYHETKRILHLQNAFKYSLTISTQVASVVWKIYPDSTPAMYLYISIAILSTAASYTWDTYIDWGLFRSREKGKWLLRHKIMFPSYFYYVGIVTNLLMRLAWTTTFTQPYLPTFLHDENNLILFLSVLEIVRRAQWAVIRIENENVNNFERYRNILQIPELDDDLPYQDTKKAG